jgi:PAS domain S-box-containing protein
MTSMPNWLRRLFASPIFADEEKTRISQFMITFSWYAICVLMLLILFRIGKLTESSLMPLIILVSVILILLFIQSIVRLGYIREASVTVIVSMWSLMTYLAWQSDGVRDTALIAYIVVILLCSLLLGWQFASFIGGISIAAIWYFGYVEKFGIHVFTLDDPLSYATDLSGILVLTGVLIYLLTTAWSRSLQSARIELQERLRAEGKLQRQTNYLTALNETALGLLNRSELKPLLESILSRACELNETPHGIIEMVLPDGSALRQEMGSGVYEKLTGMLTSKNIGVTGTVWANAQSVIINNYPEWEHGVPEFITAGFQAVMGVPLKLGDTVIGVLAFAYTDRGRLFDDEQLKLMERFAALASLAIDNARLSEMTQKESRDRSMAEIALLASEERFRKVFQASPVAICITTLEEGRLLDGNDAYWKMSGYDPENSIGRTAEELGMGEDSTERRKFVEEIKVKRSIVNADFEFETNKMSEARSAIAFYELIEIKDQTCIMSMFYDITDQNEARESLQNSEARTRAILASIPDMIFEISKDGTFLDFMASAEITPIMPPAQFLGKNIRELFPPVIADQTFFALGRALATDQLHAFEYGLPPGNETQFFEARITAITSESAIIMVRDISQRKYVLTDREKLINELEDKNSELERFTYTVSHDLKSPLITIKGFLGFVEQDAVNGNLSRLKTDIQRIGDATNKMQLLLNELLELSRVGRLTNPHQEINFEELVNEVVELLHGRLHEKEIVVDVQKQLPLIYGDRRRLFEVLQNLVDNAAKFTGTQPHPRIEIGQNGQEDGKPILFVKDNGLGIDPLHQERIFGLFNKLDSNSDGTGVGLALVKRIVEVHGGRIWVESAPGNGSTFFFTLPIGPAA